MIVVNRSGFAVNNVTAIRELELIGTNLINQALSLLENKETEENRNTYACTKVYEGAITNQGNIVNKARIKVLEFWVLNSDSKLIDTAKVLIA